MQIVGERGVRITPDVSVQGGSGDTSRGLLDGLLGLKLRDGTAVVPEAPVKG